MATDGVTEQALGLVLAAGSERRGRSLSYVSYWSQRDRRRRAEVFQRRDRGEAVRTIASAMRMGEHEVQAILLTDRRRRTP